MNEDALAKIRLESMLKPFMPLVVHHEVQPPAQDADLFVSGPPTAPKALVDTLGTLGRIASQPTLLEPFSDTLTLAEARDCQRKQLTLHHVLELESKGPVVFPWLWMLSLGRPTTVLREWHLRPSRGWPRGIYRRSAGLAVGVVVLRALPLDRETLTLRLFGDQAMRQQVVAELGQVPDAEPMKVAVRQMLYRWQVRLLSSPEDQEMRRRVMDFEQLVEQHTQKLMNLGRAEGELKGELKEARRSLGRVIARRGLVLSAEQTAQIAACAELETLERWLDQSVTAATADEALR